MGICSTKLISSVPTISHQQSTVSMSVQSIPTAVVQRNITKRVVENFILVWLDASISEANADNEKPIDEFRKIINCVKLFTNSDACIDFLTTVQIEQIFLIVSRSFSELIVPCVEDLAQIHSIYVFCRNESEHEKWWQTHEKVRGIFIQIDHICASLVRDMKRCDIDTVPINILGSSTTTTSDLNHLEPSFMYSQLLKEILFEIKYDDQSPQKLAAYCRIQYAQNKIELCVIDEFEHEYSNHTPIWWYTRECFTYQMLNRALRTQDIEVLCEMGFFICDIHRQLEEVYRTSDIQQKISVYRGQG